MCEVVIELVAVNEVSPSVANAGVAVVRNVVPDCFGTALQVVCRFLNCEVVRLLRHVCFLSLCLRLFLGMKKPQALVLGGRGMSLTV